jgi:DNA-binding HxlR family transcriptional regulator
MRTILDLLSTETPLPFPRIQQKADIAQSTLRRALVDMEDLGLVRRCQLPPSNPKTKKEKTRPCIFGWCKTKQ